MKDVKFGEAATMFATNEGIVRAMETAYYRDLNEFWIAILKGVLAIEPKWTIEPKRVLEKPTANYFQFRRTNDKGTRPYFWVDDSWYDAAIITEGIIRLRCAWNGASPAQIAAIAALSALPGCQRSKGKASNLFTTTINCARGTSIREIAQQIADLFGELHKAVDRSLAEER